MYVSVHVCMPILQSTEALQSIIDFLSPKKEKLTARRPVTQHVAQSPSPTIPTPNQRELFIYINIYTYWLHM